MPTQTIVVGSTEDDGYRSGSSWTGNYPWLYISTSDVAGFTFTVGTAIPSGSTINRAYLRIYNHISEGGNGTTTNRINLRDADPGTVAQWGSGNLPPTDNTGAIGGVDTGTVSWATSGWRFGESDTTPIDLSAPFQSLVNSYGGIAANERVALWIRTLSGTGYGSIVDFSTSRNPPERAELFIEWTEGGGASQVAKIMTLLHHG